jgi:hypothetical protein
MKSLEGSSFEEIAFEVCSALDAAGVLVVLSGGGAASIYAPRAHVTQDLDFVLARELFGVPNDAPLRELGFVMSRARGIYEHPDIPYTLEILEGPLAVGEETLAVWETRRKGDLVLHIVRPIDSVKDRLAAAIHFKDLNSARQAAEIAKLHAIDLDAVRDWCESEGGSNAFALFGVLLRG